MAILPSDSGTYTLQDIASAHNTAGEFQATVMLLNQTNSAVLDFVFTQANKGNTYESYPITSLPEVSLRKYNQGTPNTKYTRSTIVDTLGRFSTRARIDLSLYYAARNPESMKAEMAATYMEALNQRVARSFFYGNEQQDASDFTGIATRYNTLTGNRGQRQVLDAGGTGSDNTSIYIVTWGDGCKMFYPQDSQYGAGIGFYEHEQEVPDADGNPFMAKSMVWDWNLGLTIPDYRNVARICNIDVSDLQAGTGTQAPLAPTNIITLLDQIVPRMGGSGGLHGRTVMYVNQKVYTGLINRQRLDLNTSLNLENRVKQLGNIGAGSVHTTPMSYLGVEVRQDDQILNTETVVV